MNRQELKAWAKEKIKGHMGELILAIFITNLVTQLTIGARVTYTDGHFQTHAGFPLGILFYFVSVGFAYFMVKFINDQEHSIRDLFNFSSDFARCLVTNLLQSIFIFLWSLLLVVPGIIKSLSYSLVSLLLADEKYKDTDPMQILKKSTEIMNGHKMDLFVLGLSFIGWHLLACLTCGILEFWIMPYQQTATYKFLNDIKEEYEKNNK